LREFADAHGGLDSARLKEDLEDADRRSAGCCKSINQLVISQPWECDKLSLPLSSNEEMAGGGLS
jgi:hypothetical protein